VALQFALSLTLLATAGVLLGSVAHLRSMDLGFRSSGLIAVSLSPSRLGYDDDRIDRLFDDIRSRLLETPGVASAAFSWSAPLATAQGTTLRLAPTDKPLNIKLDFISPGYFETMGIPLQAGRDLTTADTVTDTATPVVLSRLAATKLFGAVDVVGRSLLSGDERWTNRSYVVVGIVGDIRREDLRGDFEPTVYEPARHALRRGAIVIRSSRPTADIAETARRVIHDVDPALPAGESLTIPARLDELTSVERLLAKLGSVVAVLAALLAAGGLYALVSFVVAERTREMGIRIALGASGGRVVREVLRSLLLIGAGGLVGGALFMALTARWLTSRLFGVSAFDPLTLAGAVLLLVVVALLAGSVPARRASRVNPVVALRVD
jgi:predicted permease